MITTYKSVLKHLIAHIGVELQAHTVPGIHAVLTSHKKPNALSVTMKINDGDRTFIVMEVANAVLNFRQHWTKMRQFPLCEPTSVQEAEVFLMQLYRNYLTTRPVADAPHT